MEQIQKAVSDLYGDWSSLPDSYQSFIENVMQDGRFTELYAQTLLGEQETKNLLVHFEKDYPGVTKEGNVDTIAEHLQQKSNKASILAKLRQKQNQTEQPVPSEKPEE